MATIPHVIRAQYQGEYRLMLTFDDGLVGAVDFHAWLHGPVFEPLKNLEYFRAFVLEGGTVAWPNGADIAPETLYASASKHRAA